MDSEARHRLTRGIDGVGELTVRAHRNPASGRLERRHGASGDGRETRVIGEIRSDCAAIDDARESLGNKELAAAAKGESERSRTRRLNPRRCRRNAVGIDREERDSVVVLFGYVQGIAIRIERNLTGCRSIGAERFGRSCDRNQSRRSQIEARNVARIGVDDVNEIFDTGDRNRASTAGRDHVDQAHALVGNVKSRDVVAACIHHKQVAVIAAKGQRALDSEAVAATGTTRVEVADSGKSAIGLRSDFGQSVRSRFVRLRVNLSGGSGGDGQAES